MMYQGFLLGARFRRSVFSAHGGSDHEHCAMCGAKFSERPGDLREGYVTLNGGHWVCACATMLRSTNGLSPETVSALPCLRRGVSYNIIA